MLSTCLAGEVQSFDTQCASTQLSHNFAGCMCYVLLEMLDVGVYKV
jgi:hypothetical protein